MQNLTMDLSPATTANRLVRTLSRRVRSLIAAAMTLGLCASSRAALVGHWKLDNDLTDSAGTHNGTMVGTETHVFGEVGKAVSLNGASQVTLGVGAVPTSAYTKSAWVWCAGSATNSILSGDDATSRHVLWVPASNGGLLSAGHNGNYTVVQDNIPLALSNWVHVAVTYDSAVNGGTLKLYKNGVLVGGSQAIASNVTAATATSANIGGFNGNGYFNGIIDDVGVWNTALSDAQILAIYNSGLKHVPLDRTTNSVFNLVPEANDYTILYELPIPNAQNLGTNGWPGYITDYSQAYNNPFGFDRVAYYLELQTASNAPLQWVYASMDRFSTNTITLGVPSVISGAFFQQNVTNLNVYSSSGAVTTGTNIQTGNIEFWGWSYITANGAGVPFASDAVYDSGDAIWYQGTYGSMQIHNHASGAQTIMAYNAWANGGGDVGIGNAGTANTDWTFAGNAGSYAVKNLLVLIRPATLPNVTFTSMPKNMQLYPRSLQTDTANVTVSGTVNDPGYDQIVVNVSRAGALYTNMTQALTYAGGHAAFSQTTTIFSELAEYNFTVSLVQTGQPTQVASATNVVAGDVILVNGQSNAEAMEYVGSANGNQSGFLRSFGSRAAAPQGVAADLNWRIAEGDQSQDPAAVGQWPLKMGRLIVDTYQIPVAIINEAYPGEPIGYFPRNNANPLDLTTNYGCLLYRVQQAGVENAVRAILFFQGESDNDNGAVQESGFMALYRNWLKDYPSVERTYVFQVRPGCTVTQTLGDLRNRQRLYADKFPGIEVMTTEGVDGRYNQSGLGYCHYVYSGGYETIGNQIFGVVARDLYGAPALGNLDSLNVAYAYYSQPGHNEITIITRNVSDSITFQSGAQADFVVQGSGVTVTSGTASGNKIILELSGDGNTGTGISYNGHAGPGSWVLNSTGVGMLTFYNQMINLSSNTAPVAPSGLSASTYATTEQDLKWNATTNAAYYIILRNGVEIGTTYDTVFYDMNVAPGSSYAYSVEAVGLTATSAPSATITAPTSIVAEQNGGLIASDNAGDVAYSPAWPYQWLSGYNGGFGFGPWTLSASNTGGFFVGDSTQNGFITSGGINVYNSYNGLNLSWGMWANSNSGPAEIVADRPFNMPLGVGQTFEIYVDTGWNDGTEGFVLRTGNDTNNKNNGARFEFRHVANQNYSIIASILTNAAVGWTDGGVKVDFTLTDVDTYSVTMSGLISGVSQTINGTLGGTAGAAINSVALFDENINSGQPNFDLYFNSMSIAGGAQVTSIQLVGTNALISFDTATGFKYDLQTSTDLVAGVWSTVISNVAGTGGTVGLTNSFAPTIGNHFYRLGTSRSSP